jgi:hypothetical protein
MEERKQYKRFTLDGIKVTVILSTTSSESDSDD